MFKKEEVQIKKESLKKKKKNKRYYIVEIRDLEVELIKGVSTASANAFRIIF